MNVAVLGAGPSGLLAAWAVIDAGHTPVVFEKNPRVPDGSTAGVYFLHDSCNLPLRRKSVQIITSGGSKEDYRRKLYGEKNVDVSWPEREKKFYESYDGMQAMAMCWDIVHQFIEVREIPTWEDVLYLAKHHDMLVNTIPLRSLIPERRWDFQLATIYRSTAPVDESYMLYNANPAVPWYRASAVFGAFTLEYVGNHQISATNTPEIDFSKSGKYSHVLKVISTPDSMPEVPDNMLLTGRYGSWNKRKLSHHAYTDTMKFLCHES